MVRTYLTHNVVLIRYVPFCRDGMGNAVEETKNVKRCVGDVETISGRKGSI